MYCQRQVRNTHKTAMIVGISNPLLTKYLELHQTFIKDKAYSARLQEIEETGAQFWDTEIAKKKQNLKTLKEDTK